SLIRYFAAGNRLSERSITSPEASEEKYEYIIEVQTAKRGTLFQSEKAKQPPKELEATIQSDQMDTDKEEARPNPEVASLHQERHIWRMLELPPFPKVCTHKI
ncbi:hypothetical protein O181_125642, partial [Austropuccinia psidii MF-1]|nr:hypothetical protein [Austropuccinia psidii MF-1]